MRGLLRTLPMNRWRYPARYVSGSLLLNLRKTIGRQLPPLASCDTFLKSCPHIGTSSPAWNDIRGRQERAVRTGQADT